MVKELEVSKIENGFVVRYYGTDNEWTSVFCSTKLELSELLLALIDDVVLPQVVPDYVEPDFINPWTVKWMPYTTASGPDNYRCYLRSERW